MNATPACCSPSGPQAKPPRQLPRALARLLGPLPAPWRQTVTFDNGTEFARHHQLHALGIETFFCDTHAPWQKGGVENAIGRLRRGLPRKTDLATVSADTRLRSWCSCTIIRPASVWTTGHPPKCSGRKCCTSNVNPPSRLRGNDGSGLFIAMTRKRQQLLAVVLASEQGRRVERLADQRHRAVRLQQVLGRPSMAEEGQRRHR